MFVTSDCIVPNIVDFQATFNFSSKDSIFVREFTLDLSINVRHFLFFQVASPPTFDPFYVDIFAGFLSRSRLLLTSPRIKIEAEKLINFLTRERATFCQMTPTLFKRLSNRLWTAKFKSIVIGGESFPSFSVAQDCSIDFYQAYGITEMSCWQSLYKIRREDIEKEVQFPIFDPSRPNLISKTKVCIQGKEIFVQSDTRKAMIQTEDGQIVKSTDNPLSTGDLGIADKDGLIFFSSRAGDRVKIHGKLTNLMEIEREVRHVTSADCVCLLTQDNAVMAFFENITWKTLEKFEQSCRSALPTFKCPSKFWAVAQIPVTAHGKVDRKALESLVINPSSKITADCTLSELWLKHTGNEPKESSRFLSDGGDSFDAVQIVNVIENGIGCTLPHLFEALISKTFEEIKAILIEAQEPKLEATPACSVKRMRLNFQEDSSSSLSIPFVTKGRSHFKMILESAPTFQKLQEKWSLSLGKYPMQWHGI